MSKQEIVNVIVDSNNLSYRMFSTLDLWNDHNEHVGSLFGVIKNIHSLAEMFTPNRIIMTWDPSKGSEPWRRSVYPAYKMNRKKDLDEDAEIMLQEFYRQNELLQFCLGWLPIHQIVTDDLEADDIMYWLAKHTLHEDHNIVVTSDEDLLQLVDENTAVWSPIKELMIVSELHRYSYPKSIKVVTFEEYFNQKFKKKDPETLSTVKLKQHVDYKIMVGDTSDNVAGIPGIGEKTAVKLLEEYGSLSRMLKNPEPLLATKTSAKVVADPYLIDTLRSIMDISYVEEFKHKSLVNLQAKEIKPNVDLKRFWNLCKSNDFKSIYMDYRIWTRPFEKMKVVDIFDTPKKRR